MLSADARVFLWINGFVGKVALFDKLMTGLVNDYFVPVVMSLVLVGLWFWGRDVAERDNCQRGVIIAMIGVGIVNLAVEILNGYYFRLRPFAEHDVNLLFYEPHDSSFPSNPAAVAFALATGVWLRNRHAGVLLYCIAALFAFARVYAGVCYPLDVVAGAAVGALCSYAVYWFLRLVEPLPTVIIKVVRLLHLA